MRGETRGAPTSLGSFIGQVVGCEAWDLGQGQLKIDNVRCHNIEGWRPQGGRTSQSGMVVRGVGHLPVPRWLRQRGRVAGACRVEGRGNGSPFPAAGSFHARSAVVASGLPVPRPFGPRSGGGLSSPPCHVGSIRLPILTHPALRAPLPGGDLLEARLKGPSRNLSTRPRSGRNRPRSGLGVTRPPRGRHALQDWRTPPPAGPSGGSQYGRRPGGGRRSRRRRTRRRRGDRGWRG